MASYLLDVHQKFDEESNLKILLSEVELWQL